MMTEVGSPSWKVTNKASKSYLGRPSDVERKSSFARKSAIKESLGVLLVVPEPESTQPKSKTQVQSAGKQATTIPRRDSSLTGGKKMKGASGLLNDPFIDALLGMGVETSSPVPALQSPRGPRRLWRTSSSASSSSATSTKNPTTSLRKSSSIATLPESIKSMNRTASFISVPEINATFGNSTASMQGRGNSSWKTSDSCLIPSDVLPPPPPPPESPHTITPDRLYGKEHPMGHSSAQKSNKHNRRPRPRPYHADSTGDWGTLALDDLYDGESIREVGTESDDDQDYPTPDEDGDKSMDQALIGEPAEEDQDKQPVHRESWETEPYIEELNGSIIIPSMVPQEEYRMASTENDDGSDRESLAVNGDLRPSDTRHKPRITDNGKSCSSIMTDGMSLAASLTVDSMMTGMDHDEDMRGASRKSLDSLDTGDGENSRMDDGHVNAVYNAPFENPEDTVISPGDIGGPKKKRRDSWTELEFDFADLNVAIEKKKSKKKSRDKVSRSKSGDVDRSAKGSKGQRVPVA